MFPPRSDDQVHAATQAGDIFALPGYLPMVFSFPSFIRWNGLGEIGRHRARDADVPIIVDIEK
jgi:hypothetical protein